MGEINGRALAAVAVGTIFVWSGVRGWSILATIGSVVQGKAPSATPIAPLTVPGLPPGETPDNGVIIAPTGGQGAAIAAEGQRWVGHPYRFGGSPGMDGKGFWDCSSFCNFIYGIKFGLPLPGYGPGKYRGNVHGPPTMAWNVWPGLTNVSREQVQAGDVILWIGHMGIAISNSHMVHAPNPKRGTVIDRIEVEGKPVRMGRYT